MASAGFDGADEKKFRAEWSSRSQSRLARFAIETLDPQKEQRPDNRVFVEQSWDEYLGRSPRPQITIAPGEQVRPGMDEALCDRCSKINLRGCTNGDVQIPNIHGIKVLGTFLKPQLYESCRFCRQMSQLLARYPQEFRGNNAELWLIAFPTSALFADAWTWEPAPYKVTSTVSLSIMDCSTLSDRSRMHQQQIIRETGFLSPIISSGDYTCFHARPIGEKLYIPPVKSWLGFCAYYHVRACSSASPPSECSVRVIDCDRGAVVRLSSDPSDQRYLALSYVWGETGQAQSAECSTKEAVRQNKVIDPPQTIKDAMELTLQLGYRYLWVDQYCIPQHDYEEKSLQMSQMDRIYAGAEATIIAAAGVDPHHGLSGMSRQRKSHPGDSESVMISDVLYTAVPPDPALELRAAVWNKRAWTYQESVLSRRRLVFCDRQVYFECSAMHCYESIQAPLKLMHQYPGDAFSKWNEPGLFPTSHHRQPLDQLFHHLALYTMRDLSYPGDILNGMLGIFGAFSRKAVAAPSKQKGPQILQVAGIPIAPSDALKTETLLNPDVAQFSQEEQFITALSWKLRETRERREGFPSWSWTGWAGPVQVQPRSDNAGYITNTHGLSLQFGATWELTKGKISGGLDTVLAMMQNKWLPANYIPTIVATGDCVMIDVHRHENGSMEATTGVCSKILYWNHFHLCSREVELMGADDLRHQQFAGLVLGVAQATRSVGNTQVLDEGQFAMVVLVLWRRKRYFQGTENEDNSQFERCGLIEHSVPTYCTSSGVIECDTRFLDSHITKAEIALD